MGKVLLLPFKKLKEKAALYLFVLRQLRLFPTGLSVYEEAFRRKNTAARGAVSYQRLEFLGDTVIDLIVAGYLYRRYPGASEGDMTIIKSRLVKKEALAFMSKCVKLERFIDRSSHTDTSVPIPEHVLADTMESFVAAIYLDKNYEVAERYFLRLMKKEFKPESVAVNNHNYKGLILEWGQKHKRRFFFENKFIDSRTKLQHRYKVSLYINEEWVSAAMGKSKKHAEQKASKRALEQLNIALK